MRKNIVRLVTKNSLAWSFRSSFGKTFAHLKITHSKTPESAFEQHQGWHCPPIPLRHHYCWLFLPLHRCFAPGDFVAIVDACNTSASRQSPSLFRCLALKQLALFVLIQWFWFYVRTRFGTSIVPTAFPTILWLMILWFLSVPFAGNRCEDGSNASSLGSKSKKFACRFDNPGNADLCALQSRHSFRAKFKFSAIIWYIATIHMSMYHNIRAPFNRYIQELARRTTVQHRAP